MMPAPRSPLFARRLAALLLALPAVLLGVQSPPVVRAQAGKLDYVAAANGDRLPDFSAAGYAGGGTALPRVPAVIAVSPQAGDATAAIQAALDDVARREPDAHGFRGAVLLLPGRYELSGRLAIRAGGVVLRGAGEQTVLVAAGTDRRALIAARGKERGETGHVRVVTDERAPVGATKLTLDDARGLAAGDIVRITRPTTPAWVHALGMDVAPGRQQFAWKPAAMSVRWTRTIAAVEGQVVTLDAPITTALEKKFGGATLAALGAPGPLRQIGVENLRCESAFDAANPLDEQHAWEAVFFEHVEDGWIANVTAAHFAGSAFNLGPGSRRVTVQDCASVAPVSELGGYRRHTFHTSGEQTLFLRCRAEDGRNDFTVGYLAGGPNVFLECRAERSRGFSGSVGSWASGILFDNVTLDGGTLELNNRETWNQGVGWAAANSMLWQCSAPVVICRQPPTAQNWADGVWGQFVGDGHWSQVNEFIKPESLYRAQLEARLGLAALGALEPRTFAVDVGRGLPTPPERRREQAGSGDPALQSSNAGRPLALTHGVLTVGGARLSGREQDISWWRGYLYAGAEPTQPALTRFVPGQHGLFFTDDLDELTDAMAAKRRVVLRHHYGLWYERRRMDHERMRRPDGDVWPPFFEQPFARSGQGSAWDGLSRYDLTKYNAWYFARLREFAGLARQKGLVLVNEMYFQHNILEAGAHWVDSPWRPTNNINGTRFTEPPPFAGDTVKMAAEFYDLSDPAYRALHRAYIRQCLANLADEPNVIHTLGAENSGPLSFMQFWLDVVAEWEAETGRHPLIALSACKDVQDAILADPRRAAVVDVIDFTYWFRTERGDEFAPRGGTDLAPRQHQRLWKGGRPSAKSIAAMAAEYRARFPGKAILTGLPEAGDVQP